MQVLCKASQHGADTTCTICGQGFVLYWERQTRRERAKALDEVANTLREHHSEQSGPRAHPNHGFLVPEWHGPAAGGQSSMTHPDGLAQGQPTKSR